MTSYTENPLTADELLMLAAIAGQVRELARGLATGRTSVAQTIARRAGTGTAPASVRALVAMPDLRRPRRETLEAIARGVGRPELADTWWTAWQSVQHPEPSR